jgi:hypothetical protein
MRVQFWFSGYEDRGCPPHPQIRPPPPPPNPPPKRPPPTCSPCLMMSTIDLRWGRTAQPMRMAICWMILMPVWRAWVLGRVGGILGGARFACLGGFVFKNRRILRGASTPLQKVKTRPPARPPPPPPPTPPPPKRKRALIKKAPPPLACQLFLLAQTALRKGRSAGMPRAEATTEKARAVVLRTYLVYWGGVGMGG